MGLHGMTRLAWNGSASSHLWRLHCPHEHEVRKALPSSFRRVPGDDFIELSRFQDPLDQEAG